MEEEQFGAAADIINYSPFIEIYLKRDLHNPIKFCTTFQIDLKEDPEKSILDMVKDKINKSLIWKETADFLVYEGDNPKVICFKCSEIAYYVIEDTRFS